MDRPRVDYRNVTPASLTESVDAALARVSDLVAAVVDERIATYEGTLELLEAAGLLLDDVTGRTAFLGHVHPDADVRDAGHVAEERIEKSRVAIRDSADVAAAIRRYAGTADARALTGDRRVVLERWSRDIRRAGHDLSEAERAEVKRLRMRIVELEVAFTRNVETERPQVDVTPEELAALPGTLAERVERDTDERPVLPLNLSTVSAFLEDAPSRALRERIERRWLSRAVDANRPVLEEILAARRRLARLLGYASWADYRTETRMAGDAASVDRLVAMVEGPLRKLARTELAAMAERLRADGSTTEPVVVEEWDWRYYDAVLRREQGVDPQLLADHLPLEAVLSGLFALVEDVFGVSVAEAADVDGWHPDVRRFVLTDKDSGEVLGESLFDPFPRDGKDPGAFAWTVAMGRRGPDGAWIPAVSALVTNITPPSATAPSLLRHSEVETIFHEFGHVLDGILTRSDRPWFAWDWLPLDWVEAPSQIMEHWTWDPDVLRQFARHHRTGAPPPDAVLGRLPELRRLNVGLQTVWLVSRTVLDLRLHAPDPVLDPDAAYRAAWSVREIPFIEGSFEPAAFLHLVTGYDAGYYGYLWAQVYGDDMFGRFRRDGVMSADVGRAYRREVLEPSWTVEPIDRLRRFLGRDPASDAFLERLGIAGREHGPQT